MVKALIIIMVNWGTCICTDNMNLYYYKLPLPHIYSYYLFSAFEMFKVIHSVVDDEEALCMVYINAMLLPLR